ncbi:MAG: nucleoside triphosphate pyrophosphohydrolase [Chitinophagaceae bacterium]|nr:nucleoside triphosphate pyrophosphohydrolase [Chitinophagaceae bacterium]
MNDKNSTAFLRLVKIMDELREQCPWDKKQTIATLRQLTIEETYELADAITDEDWQGIKEELGDLLLHIVFYARIGKEQKQFDLAELIHGVCEKLISRHPHIYGNKENNGEPIHVENDEEVKKNWEKLKLKEGKKSVLSGVPRSLPATVKAMRLQEKARQVGFEWDERDQVWDKVDEEIAELKTAVRQLDDCQDDVKKQALHRAVEMEFGDLVFSLINYARFLRVDAENALTLTNKKFIQRFTQMEAMALAEGKDIRNLGLQEMDAIWNAIKKQQSPE